MQHYAPSLRRSAQIRNQLPWQERSVPIQVDADN